jgi:DNA primase
VSALDVVVGELESHGCSPRGNDHRGYTALCPAHDDRNPSLSVSYKQDRVLVHCHAGCDPEAVVDALGIQFKDLFDDDRVRA